jgi:hypothetical protein
MNGAAVWRFTACGRRAAAPRRGTVGRSRAFEGRRAIGPQWNGRRDGRGRLGLMLDA